MGRETEVSGQRSEVRKRKKQRAWSVGHGAWSERQRTGGLKREVRKREDSGPGSISTQGSVASPASDHRRDLIKRKKLTDKTLTAGYSENADKILQLFRTFCVFCGL